MVRLDLKFHTRQQGAADGRLAHPPNLRSSASIRARHPHTSARASAGAHQPLRTSLRPPLDLGWQNHWQQPGEKLRLFRVFHFLPPAKRSVWLA